MKKYKITSVRTGHSVKYPGNGSVSAVKAFFTQAGLKPSEFEIAEPDAGVVLRVSRRDEEPILVIVRDTPDALAPISNFPQEAQVPIPGLTC